jgi:hypothetical protein
MKNIVNITKFVLTKSSNNTMPQEVAEVWGDPKSAGKRR